MSRCESVIRNEHRKITAERRCLTGHTDVRLSKDEARAAKARIDRSYAVIAHNRWRIGTARSLCDGLAFAFLSKWDIKPLSSKEAAGHISGKAGASLERRILRAIAFRGRTVAILNDLTNCLRHGDITLPGEPPRVFEVKSGSHRTTRDERQQQKATEVANFLRNDVAANWKGTGVTLRRIEIQVPERHHRRRLPEMIRSADDQGMALSWPEPGLCYLALGRTSAETALRRVLPRFKSPPLVVPLVTTFAPSYWLPLSLSIRDGEAWWLVETRAVTLVVLVDCAKVTESFASRGIVARWGGNHQPHVGAGWTFPGFEGGEVGPLHVSEQFFGRVAGEFLTLRWFLDVVAERLSQPPFLGEDEPPPLTSEPKAD